MRDFTYHAPTEIVFGKGAEEKTGLLVKKYGGSRVVLLYGGRSALRSGLISRLEEALLAEGIPVLSLGGIVPNPLLSDARRMAGEAKRFGADFVLAAGGGSVIDTAKAVAHSVANPDADIWDIWLRKTPIKKSLPVGAVLTIAAAGSETSNSAVLTNDDTEALDKRGLSTDFNRCRFAVMNPELTMSLPAWQIGAGAADIFMHTAERYFATEFGNHLTDEFAEGLMRNIILYGPRGVENPGDYEAMSEIMWSGSVSHVGLTGLGAAGKNGRDGDWACHQLGMAISAIYDSTHGATLTAVWGTWARYVRENSLFRFADFARKVMGVAEKDNEKAAEEGICRAEEFFRKLGMPVSVGELIGHALSEEEADALADRCSYGKARTVGGVKVLDYQDMKAIYMLAGGTGKE